MNQLQPRAPKAKTGGMTVKEFLAFYRTRPDDERWQLIDGVATPMPPPALVHGRIASNLHVILANHLNSTGVDLCVYGESGVRVPKRDYYLPVPDLMIAPPPTGTEVYSEKFVMAVEVLSPRNRKRDIALKLNYYKDHGGCAHVIIVESRRVRLELHERAADWEPQVFTGLSSVVDLQAFGLSFKLGELYARTPLL